MLLDSNILIYGANGENPGLDAILDRTDLAAASVTRIEEDFKHVTGLRVVNPFASAA